MRPDPAQGVFETMLVRDGRVQALGPHLDRLAHSIAALYGGQLPPDLADRVRAAAAGLPRKHRLRVDVIPGEEVVITARPVPADTRRPVTLQPFVVAGGLGPHKWRDRRLLDIASRYRGTISGREAGSGPGAGGGPGAGATPLLVDADGMVLEGAWGNLWVLDGDTLVTPPTDGRILPGVTRAHLRELAPALGYHVREEPVSLERACRAPVTFMTSAIRLAVPATLATRPAPARAADVHRIRAALGAHF